MPEFTEKANMILENLETLAKSYILRDDTYQPKISYSPEDESMPGYSGLLSITLESGYRIEEIIPNNDLVLIHDEEYLKEPISLDYIVLGGIHDGYFFIQPRITSPKFIGPGDEFIKRLNYIASIKQDIDDYLSKIGDITKEFSRFPGVDFWKIDFSKYETPIIYY